MRAKYLWMILILLLMLLPFSKIWASVKTDLPSKLPVKVYVGLMVEDISKIDEPNELMQFDITMLLRWHDSRLAFHPNEVGGSAKIFTGPAALAQLNKIWNPQMQMENTRGSVRRENTYLKITRDGWVNVKANFQALVTSKMNFRKFPFDTQILHFDLQPFTYQSNQVQLVAMQKHKGYRHALIMSGWKILGSQINVKNTQSHMEGQWYSKFSLNLSVARKSVYYIWQIFVPIALIVFVAMSVFWIQQDRIGTRVSISLAALLTIVVYQWRIFSGLPRITYFTLLDIFMVFSFVMAASMIIPTIVYDKIQNEITRRRWVIITRWVYPIVYLLGIGIILLVYLS